MGSISDVTGPSVLEDPALVYNFTSDGVAKLKFEITEKLNVLMGDYTDDVLVDYVIVMLKNGRGKDEARKELDVFLGDDDSDSFVSWLWDHLASNKTLYVQPIESHSVPVSKMKSTLGKVDKKDDSHPMNSEFDREKSKMVIERHHNQAPKKAVRDSVEVPPYQGSEIGSTSMGDKTHSMGTKQLNQQPLVEKKRKRHDEQLQSKRVAPSQEITCASRRLLQFAVRDAVATARSSVVSHDPSLKRLRSAVSTPSEDSLVTDNHSKRLKSIARVPISTTTAVRAAADSANDVKKVRVFDRLGHTMDKVQISQNNQSTVKDYGKSKQFQSYAKSEHEEQCGVTNLGGETVLDFDSASDNEGYGDVNMRNNGSQTCMSHANKGDDDSLMLQYNVSEKNADDACKTHSKDVDQSGAVGTNASRKIVNISVNVNTWKPPHYQSSMETDSRKAILEKADAQVKMANNNLLLPSNVLATTTANSQKATQKVPNAPAPFSADHALDDADSRTIFVSNVHFGATKETLSRHFSKFGDVLKVVIITDAATGYPKGAAYVEFMRKEAAELALSLDATSFMSRILKVVRRSASNREVVPATTSARGVRGPSLVAPPKFRRASCPRTVAASRGGRRMIPKPACGRASFQWKRDAAPSSATAPSAPRGFTYVRPEIRGAAANASAK